MKEQENVQKEISVCGTDCSLCYCFGKMCNGCNSCEGKVFHAPEGKTCSIYECVKNNKCMKNCGECNEVPCKIWFNTRDPRFSDEEFNDNVAMRVKVIKNNGGKMKKLNFKDVNNWILRNARELELTVWKCLFVNESAEKVADALLPYQNQDGGFGKGLDPDNWNINSVPYACLYAIDTLEMVKFYDMNHPVYKGIKKYLERTGIENWIFTLPTNKDYPHASFYNYDEEYNKVESIGIVISFSAFILKYMADSALYESVMERLNLFIDKIYQNDLGDMGASGYITLVDTMKRLNISGYDYDELDNRLNIIVNKQMQKDEQMWKSYGYRPSDFIKSKMSCFLNGNEELVEKECEFLLRTLPTNDVWPVSWCWFENAKQYPKEEILSLHISKARKCIEKVRFLKEFDRVEDYI